MGQISAKLRSQTDGNGNSALSFFCPGCRSMHSVQITGSYVWGYNGNPDSPTFTPSVLVKSGHYASADGDTRHCWCEYNRKYPEEVPRFQCHLCHSFVTDGKIQYLADCTHDLAGQTIDLPDLPEIYSD